jgi:hypothetical protein
MEPFDLGSGAIHSHSDWKGPSTWGRAWNGDTLICCHSIQQMGQRDLIDDRKDFQLECRDLFARNGPPPSFPWQRLHGGIGRRQQTRNHDQYRELAFLFNGFIAT